MQTDSNESKNKGPFREMLESSTTFIDRTNVIYGFFHESYINVVAGPKGYGKSTILDMLKCFLEIGVDEKGNILSEDLKAGRAVKDTANYNLFMEHKLNITKHADLMNDHFGKHPVILLSFSTNSSVTSVEEVPRIWAEILHHAYKQHEYLLNTGTLDDIETELMQCYCCEQYDQISNIEVNFGLQMLTELLFNHFQRRCVILVDDYDSMILKPSYVTHDRNIYTRIGRKMCGIMSCALTQTSVFRVFITGTSTAPSLVFFTNIHREFFVFSNDSRNGFTYEETNKQAVHDHLRYWRP